MRENRALDDNSNDIPDAAESPSLTVKENVDTVVGAGQKVTAVAACAAFALLGLLVFRWDRWGLTPAPGCGVGFVSSCLSPRLASMLAPLAFLVADVTAATQGMRGRGWGRWLGLAAGVLTAGALAGAIEMWSTGALR